MIFSVIKRVFIREPLFPEAALAYWNKLPNQIQVEWFRDGKFIIGKINSEGYEFMTQAFSAEEFVEMVNDALLAVYEIPKEYFKLLSGKRLQPTPEQFRQLNDDAVNKCNISFVKEFATV